MSSPTARSLAYCRKMGWVAAVTERWNAHAGIRQDLFGFIDLIVLKPGLDQAEAEDAPRRIVAVQVTSASNRAARRTKILETPRAAAWCAAGGTIELWTWAKRGERGKRKLWTLTREAITV